MARADEYFKIRVVDLDDLVEKDGQKVLIVGGVLGQETEVRDHTNGVITWHPVEVRGHVEMKSIPKMMVKAAAQQAYENYIGDRWVTYVALYLPVQHEGQAPQGYTEPLWGFWRERRG